MPSRRDQIKMTPEEVGRFLVERRMLILATLGKDGWPHLTALWYVLRDFEPWVFTYAKSQKVRNLERDSRATLLVEGGRSYDDVRGAMLTVHAKIHRDFDTVAAVAEELFARYASDGQEPGLDERRRETVRARAAKRVAVQFQTVRAVTWDHSKLGGNY